jgi:hypothetical protein
MALAMAGSALDIGVDAALKMFSPPKKGYANDLFKTIDKVFSWATIFNENFLSKEVANFAKSIKTTTKLFVFVDLATNTDTVKNAIENLIENGTLTLDDYIGAADLITNISDTAILLNGFEIVALTALNLINAIGNLFCFISFTLKIYRALGEINQNLDDNHGIYVKKDYMNMASIAKDISIMCINTVVILSCLSLLTTYVYFLILVFGTLALVATYIKNVIDVALPNPPVQQNVPVQQGNQVQQNNQVQHA